MMLLTFKVINFNDLNDPNNENSQLNDIYY
jgi:hypothetical protein